MKIRLLQFVGLCLLPLLVPMGAEEPSLEPSLERSDEQLEQLFGPIALYPDALIAIILPASTVPSDVVLAARYLEAKGAMENVDAQPWDDSVKSLVHYPEVVKWMDANLAWTKQAGEAFLAQPAGVMNAIQRLRAKARAAGTLTDTPQQRVVVEGDAIQIVPTEPDVIYVPVYDPDIVYVSTPGFYSDPFLTFGPGYMAGFWLGYSMDWGHRRIWTIDRRDRQRYWHDHRDWRRPPIPAPGANRHNAYRSRPWAPSPNYPRPPQRMGNRPRPEIAHPTPPQRRPVAPNSTDLRPGGPQPGLRPEGPQPAINRHRENRPAPPANVENHNVRPAPGPVAPGPAPQTQLAPATSPVPPQSQSVRRERPPERREARSERGEAPGNSRYSPPGRIQSSPATAGAPSLQRAAPPRTEVRSRPARSPEASRPAPRSAPPPPPPPPPVQSNQDGRSPRG